MHHSQVDTPLSFRRSPDRLWQPFRWLDGVGKWHLPPFHYNDQNNAIISHDQDYYFTSYLPHLHHGYFPGWTRLINPNYISGPYVHAHLQKMHLIYSQWCLVSGLAALYLPSRYPTISPPFIRTGKHPPSPHFFSSGNIFQALTPHNGGRQHQFFPLQLIT